MLDMVTLARHLMGTRFELVLRDGSGVWDEPRCRAGGEEALDEIERLDRQLSMYRPDSEVAALNARAADEWVTVEPRLFRLLERMRALWAATGGAFDPTVGPLLRAWGFQGGSGRRPGERAVEAACRLTGMQNVCLDAEAHTVHFARPGVALDVGAVGKGYAVEQAVEVLRELGVTDALLHGGTSTVAALGRSESGDAWKIAVADPADPARTVTAIALADGQSLSVSGAHGKAFTGPDGRVYGHVLDPRSGRPVAGTRLSAVVMDDPTAADVLSTALLVLGREGFDVLSAWPEAGALVLSDDGTLHRCGTLLESKSRLEG